MEKVGTFDVIAPTEVQTGTRVPLALNWAVPAGNWHDLTTVDLRLRDDQGTIAWLRFDEHDRTLSLFNPDSGKFGPAVPLGSQRVLSNSFATIYLQTSRVQAAGPTSPAVTLLLDMSFKHRAAGRTFAFEVAAADDLGNVQEFQRAATVAVLD